MSLRKLKRLKRSKSKEIRLRNNNAPPASDNDLMGLGAALRAQGCHASAIDVFNRILTRTPDDIQALRALAAVYVEQGLFKEAVPVFEKITRKRPEDVDALTKLAIVHQKCGNLAQSVALYKKALELRPEFLPARLSLVETLERYNKVDEAYSEVLAGLKIFLDDTSIAIRAAACERRLNKYQKALDRLLSLDPGKMEMFDQRYYYFELGRVCNKLKDYDKAFSSFARGNIATRKLSKQIDAKYYLERIAVVRDGFQSLKSLPPTEHSLQGDNPVFLVGFPRSGTTLMDQILDCHPMLQTMEEQNIVETIENRVADPFEQYVSGWQSLSAEQIKTMQDEYYNEVAKRITREEGKILVDRMPLNITRIALIWRLFPGAKFILVVRHPIDVCLSCFMQNFKANTANVNFFSLEDAALFYSRVMELWRLYVELLPISYHMVRYEDLVADLEGESRRILEFLGLGWDENVLKFYQHARGKEHIKTASYHQVNRPIYKDAVYRWQRYEKYCEPIKDKLAPYIEYFGY
jgi:thioredoxin-like negative regulator of GroEL